MTLTIALLRNFCFLQRYGLLRHPHLLVKGIVAHPIDSFHNRSEFEDPQVLHVVLCIAHSNFFVDPHALRDSWTHPILLFTFFFFPSSDSQQWHMRIQLLSGLRCGIELFLHKGRPELFHNVFSCEFGPRTQLCVWPNSACLLVKKKLSFLHIPLY